MALFFDLDGTLTDPKPGIVGCLRHALDVMEVAQPVDLDWCIGPPLQESCTKLVGPERMEEAVAAYRERYADEGLYENAVYQGIPSLLADLKATGVPLYVATSKALPFATRILEYFELAPYFSQVFGAEMDGTRANKAELLVYALEITDELAAQSIMIGDRKHDIMGGKANHMKTAGVLWGYGDQIELYGAGADFVAADIAALGDWLKGAI